jgi:hypothetical protein
LGETAMQDFTREYQAQMHALDYTDLAFWDLWAALRPAGQLSTWGLDAATERHMRAIHQQFIAPLIASTR